MTRLSNPYIYNNGITQRIYYIVIYIMGKEKMDEPYICTMTPKILKYAIAVVFI